ncbi:MAG TPA: hypothetical protein VMI55_03730 [Thermoplasmata archaeon]|nr:hypothetical protein [Thermoplasmata archaeon]
MAAPVGPTRSRPPRRPLSRSAKVGLGLLFTFLGLFLLSLLLPTAPGRFGVILPVAGAGMLLLWVGGILMGSGSRTPAS